MDIVLFPGTKDVIGLWERMQKLHHYHTHTPLLPANVKRLLAIKY